MSFFSTSFLQPGNVDVAYFSYDILVGRINIEIYLFGLAYATFGCTSFMPVDPAMMVDSFDLSFRIEVAEQLVILVLECN